MVHVGLGHEPVQASVDRRRARIEVEDAMVQRVHHGVFLGEALVEAFERLELAHVERGETIELHRAQVAARALDPQHGDVRSGEQVLVFHLGRGIAPAEIGDAEIRPQKAGAV